MNERFSGAVDTLPINIAVLDAEGTILEVNESWKRFGRDNGLDAPEQYVGTDYLSVARDAKDESAQAAIAGLEALLDGEQDSFDLVYPCHSPDEMRWFELVASAYQDNGRRRISVGHVDVTALKEREHKFEMYRDHVETQRGLALMFDEDGELIFASDTFTEMTGISENEVIGKSVGEFPPSFTQNLDPLDEVASMVNQILKNDLQVASLEASYDAEGKTVVGNVRIVPYQIDPFTEGAILTVRDITSWHNREQRLRLYERAIESASEMLAAIDREYRFLFANAAYREFNGLAENSVEGKPLEEVIGAEQQDEKVDWIERAFHGERVSYTQKRVGPNDNTHPLDIRYYPLRDREGEIVGVVTAQRDISDLRERERQLHVLDRVLRHNMHNSMTVIRGNAERIREKGTNDVRNLSKTIVTEANRLLDTVDKQRNITSLLSERTPLQRIDLATLVRTLAVRHEADTKKAEFQVTGPEDLSGRAVPQIETALDELLENAIIHSESEKPQVEIRMERDDDAVEIHVIDENPAIPEEEKKVLVGTRNIEPLFHGSGMGLWTVNWIVSRSEGELRFEADESRGNRIVIRLPAA